MRQSSPPTSTFTQNQTVEPPKCCPSCRSSQLTTTSKVVTADSYWRCGRCGEVWNAGRREHGSRGYRRF